MIKTDINDGWTPVEDAVFNRRSVRKYKLEQVPEHLIKRMLEAGRFAPSAGNCQPWRFIVIRDKKMLDEMERDIVWACKVTNFFINWRGKEGNFRPLAWLNSQFGIRLMPHELHPIPHGAIGLIAEGRLKAFHEAPTVILILKDRRGVGNPDLDCGIAGQNMVLTAFSLGLSTCWIGFATLLMKPPLMFKWKRKLGIDWPYQLVEGICVGYASGQPNAEVERETHRIEWFENGEKKVEY
jgi:nitroreductase